MDSGVGGETEIEKKIRYMRKTETRQGKKG